MTTKYVTTIIKYTRYSAVDLAKIVDEFISSELIEKESAMTKSSVVYEKYVIWSKKRGLQEASNSAFSTTLVKKFLRARVRGGTIFFGFEVKSPSD